MIKKLKRWFFKDLYIKDETRNIQIEILESKVQKLSNRLDNINNGHKFILEHFNLGIDYYGSKYDKSWAVVCINSKQPLVKFLDLDKSSAEYIRELLVKYERANKTIDAPYDFVKMFKK